MTKPSLLLPESTVTRKIVARYVCLSKNIYYEFQCIFSNFSFIFQVKKAFCYQTLFWPFTVWINCSIDLKHFENSRPSATNFKSFSRSLEQFFLTVGQNNFGNKIPILSFHIHEFKYLYIWFWVTKDQWKSHSISISVKNW